MVVVVLVEGLLVVAAAVVVVVGLSFQRKIQQLRAAVQKKRMAFHCAFLLLFLLFASLLHLFLPFQIFLHFLPHRLHLFQTFLPCLSPTTLLPAVLLLPIPDHERVVEEKPAFHQKRSLAKLGAGLENEVGHVHPQNC